MTAGSIVRNAPQQTGITSVVSVPVLTSGPTGRSSSEMRDSSTENVFHVKHVLPTTLPIPNNPQIMKCLEPCQMSCPECERVFVQRPIFAADVARPCGSTRSAELCEACGDHVADDEGVCAECREGLLLGAELTDFDMDSCPACGGYCLRACA